MNRRAADDVAQKHWTIRRRNTIDERLRQGGFETRAAIVVSHRLAQYLAIDPHRNARLHAQIDGTRQLLGKIHLPEGLDAALEELGVALRLQLRSIFVQRVGSL